MFFFYKLIWNIYNQNKNMDVSLISENILYFQRIDY